MNAEGGWNQEGIRSLTDIPVFSYYTSVINSTFWNVMYTSYKSNYILGAHTSSSTVTYNVCNIPYGHAYSILAVFSLTASNGTVYPVLMVRNPWGYV